MFILYYNCETNVSVYILNLKETVLIRNQNEPKKNFIASFEFKIFWVIKLYFK